MKKILFLLLLFVPLAAFAAEEVASADAENTWTDPVLVKSSGVCSLSISGTWSATVTLQRRINVSGAWSSWMDVETFSANAEKVVFNPSNSRVEFRAGVATGDYSSGTVEIILAD
ncbi:MAG: hypothetical protein KJP23_10485 [Deltaproteobacteria bacterium]|nr:hypothetical protein [Deltaproteobacteria bacterium]